MSSYRPAKRFSRRSLEQIIGLRNILIHAYFRVDPDEIWVVVDRDIPALKEEVVRLLSTLSGAEDAE